MPVSFPDVQSFLLYTLFVCLLSGAFFGWLTSKIIFVAVQVARRNPDSATYVSNISPDAKSRK